MEITNCNNGEIVWYQVQKHDNLNTIMQRFSTTPNNIIRNNPSIDYYEGEMVKILRHANILHIVKPMETLKSIAQKYNVEEDDLIKTNNLNSNRLFIGQTLNISNKHE